jgi:hypothetical protein
MTEQRQDYIDIKEEVSIIKADITIIKDHQETTETNIAEILKVLKGNNGLGIVTKTALHNQSIKRLWWFVGGISLSIVGVAIFIIRAGLMG